MRDERDSRSSRRSPERSRQGLEPPAVVFAYLILIMVFKPSGLLGEQTRDAG